MMKKILLYSWMTLILCSTAAGHIRMEKNGPEMEISSTAIMVNGSNISVYNANGYILEVFSLTGNKVATFRIDSNESNIQLHLKKGCYILKVKDVVRKVSIR